MSFYDDASLIMYPSGYKEDKIYSLKPTDGSGDLTFTRASTATRVNAEGLIEKVRTNLALHSEDLTNAVYVIQNATISGNTTAAPDGTTTADTFNEGSITTAHRFYQQFTITANQDYGFSFFAKKNTLDIVRLVVNDLNENFRWFGAQFNLTSGTITATATGSAGGATYINGSIVDVGNGWYRCSINGTINATTALCFVHSSTSTAITSSDDRGGISYTGTSRTFFGWGFQLETGVTTEYIPTTTAAVSVGMTADVPRIDYTGGGCGSLLLEKQSTNLVQYSEQLDNADWLKADNGSASTPVVTANYTTSPDGTQNADRVQFSRTGTTDSDYSLVTSNLCNLNLTGTATIYAKSLTSSTQNLLLYWGNGEGSVFQVTTQWTRITLNNLSAATQRILFGTRGGTGNYYNGGDLSLDVAVWGGQVEQSSYPTSYIPTVASSVTRLADTAFKTGISSLFGANAGTIYFETIYYPETNTGGGERFVFAQEDTSAGFIRLWQDLVGGNQQLRMLVNDGGTQQVNASVNVSTFLSTTQPSAIKWAMAYEANRFVTYINGVQRMIDTSGTAPTISEINFNNTFQTLMPLAQALVFPTALSDAQLETLTTI
jgi:hypothetical protein